MKINQIKEVLNSIFEEDESLKYALATNLAKYGRPQSKKSDQPSKLTKGLEKGREKYVKDLKKAGLEEDKGRDMAREFISKMRDAMRSLSDDELDTFRNDIAQAFDLNVNESISEDIGTLNQIADILGDKFDDLNFDVNEPADRIDVRGSQQDLFNFGDKLHGSKIYGYEVFHVDDDDRGEIVRIVKSDSISRGGVNEEEKKKADRCLRIARRKMPQSSAYRSGLIVKCRKGMIWKKEK